MEELVVDLAGQLHHLQRLRLVLLLVLRLLAPVLVIICFGVAIGLTLVRVSPFLASSIVAVRRLLVAGRATVVAVAASSELQRAVALPR